MNLNRSFKDFKFRHRSNKNQIIYTSKKVKNDEEVLNLIDNFLEEKNSFIFESVEKGKIKGRYTIFGKNQSLNCHSGKQIPCKIDSVCIHGDNISSLDTAKSIKNRLP